MRKKTSLKRDQTNTKTDNEAMKKDQVKKRQSD